MSSIPTSYVSISSMVHCSYKQHFGHFQSFPVLLSGHPAFRPCNRTGIFIIPCLFKLLKFSSLEFHEFYYMCVLSKITRKFYIDSITYCGFQVWIIKAKKKRKLLTLQMDNLRSAKIMMNLRHHH